LQQEKAARPFSAGPSPDHRRAFTTTDAAVSPRADDQSRRYGEHQLVCSSSESRTEAIAVAPETSQRPEFNSPPSPNYNQREEARNSCSRDSNSALDHHCRQSNAATG
jgi:hypothetical protein